MKSTAIREPHRLKFHWPQRTQISLALVGFLFLSVLLHGIAFYILQVVDPPVVVIPPPPVQVTLLTPWKASGDRIIPSPENVALLQWIDAEDPAAIANPHEIVPGNLYELQYQRSSTEIRATPKSPGENVAAVPFPPAVESMDIIASAQQSPKTAVAEMLPLPTELRFSGQLAERKITKRPPLKFNLPGTDNLRPTSFMVGVGSDGKVLYTFFMGMELDESAKAIDRQEDYLGSVEFSREPGDGIAWGIATYYWGNDAYQPGAAKP